MSYYKHPQALVEEGAVIGDNTRVWAWSHVLGGAVIGQDCNLCDHTFVENKVAIGNRVTIKCGVYIWEGITLEDDVFIGPCVAFTNDKFPRSKQYPAEYSKTIIRQGASIGANSTILPGITIGQSAMIGAGSVVTKDVPPYAIVRGNPGRIVGYVGTEKTPFQNISQKMFLASSRTGARFYDIPNFSDLRGDLGIVEWDKILPFDVKRIFFTYNVPTTEVRGEHAHKVCEQFLIALKGSLHVIADNGQEREEFILDTPSHGLHLPARIWGIQYQHSEDSVLLVLASEHYKADDYIRNYDEYLEYIKTK